MKTKDFTSICTAVLILLIFPMSACNVPGSASGYEQWDENNDALLDQEEFAHAFADAGFYDNWDRDNDGFLDKNEWKEGWGTYHSDYNEDAYGTFEDWDVNADGKLGKNEFQEGIFEIFDEDGDSFVSEDEYYSWYEEISG